MNEIIRPLAHNLGFDSFGQLIVRWEEHGSTLSTMCADMREKTCPICGKGWEVSAESFRNQLLCNVTDEFCHRTCYYGHIAMKEAEMWHELLTDYRPGRADSYFIPFNWKKIPNEYGGGARNPWHKVEFLGYVPTLKLGGRKRVYHMSMHDLRQEQVDKFLELVKGEDVTKGSEGCNSVYIHAWSKEDAKKYLGYFATVIKMDRPKEGSRAAELLAEEEKRLTPA
jgi:hypothetical protein